MYHAMCGWMNHYLDVSSVSEMTHVFNAKTTNLLFSYNIIQLNWTAVSRWLVYHRILKKGRGIHISENWKTTKNLNGNKTGKIR